MAGLATLLLFACVYAVSFEEISSGYHTLQSGASTQHSILGVQTFNGRACRHPRAELTATYIASMFQRQGLQTPAAAEVLTFKHSSGPVSATRESRISEIDEGANLTLKMGETSCRVWGPDSASTGATSVCRLRHCSPELKYDDFAAGYDGKDRGHHDKFPGGPKQTTWDFYSQKD